jgi:hypothetical protein
VTENVYSIYSLDGIIFVYFFNSPSIEDFFNAIDDVAICDQNRLRLWDLTCGIKLTSAQVKAIARYAKSQFTTPSSKVAIIAPDKLTFGLFRVHDVEREDSLVEQIVFRTERDALTWLNQGT